MGFAFPSLRPTASSRTAWRPAIGWFLACAGALAIAAAGWSALARRPAPSALARQDPDTEDLSAAKVVRCRSCGIVEQVRVLPRDAAATGYELTVRFRDGSRRRSNHSDDAGWRAGDSILLLGGTRLGDRM
jgi:hypothetical protein